MIFSDFPHTAEMFGGARASNAMEIGNASDGVLRQ